MADRRSVSSDDYNGAVTGEATIGMKGPVKTLQQVTSSGTRAQDKRAGKVVDALDIAIQDEFLKDKSSGSQEQKEATSK